MRAWNYLKNTDLIELEIESYVLVFLLRLTVGSPRDLFSSYGICDVQSDTAGLPDPSVPCILCHKALGMFRATQPGSRICLYLVFFAIARN